MLLWPDHALTSTVGLSASCVMSNTSACFSGTGLVIAGLARLTGKGYFPGPGRVILAYLMLVQRVKPTLLMMPHFLRRREQERLKTYPLLLNYSIFKKSMKEDTCLILWEFYQGHPHDSYSFLDRQWHHYFCMCWPPGLLSWNVTKLMIKQACTLK